MSQSEQVDLMNAVISGDINQVKTVLAAGAAPARPLTVEEYVSWRAQNELPDDMYFPEDIEYYCRELNSQNGGQGFHVVFEAVRFRDIFELLVNSGLDLEALDARYGVRLLHHCLICEALEGRPRQRLHLMELLLQAGAEVDAPSLFRGLTPLAIACLGKQDGALISLLLKYGASARAVDDNGDTALHWAADHNDGYSQWTLDLHWRSEGLDVPEKIDRRVDQIEPWGARELVTALVRAGADPNAVSPRTGHTPMHIASVKDEKPYVEFLTVLQEMGGLVTWPNRAGRRPLDFSVVQDDQRAAALKKRFLAAAELEDEEGIKALAAEKMAAYSFESTQIMMWDAVSENDPSSLRAALAAGADPRLPLSPEEYQAWLDRVYGDRGIEIDGTPHNFYVIFEALEHIEILKILLAAGASPSTVWTCNYLKPIIHEVVEPGLYMGDDPVAVLALLLGAGAEVDARDDEGRTALQNACRDKVDGALISLLLKYGASVQAVDNDGNTALHHAGIHHLRWPADYSDFRPEEERHQDPWGARQAVEALVAAGADPNAVNPNNGDTPMHSAAESHDFAYVEFLEALFEKGGRVDIFNHDGWRPADFFCFEDNPKAMALKGRFKQALIMDRDQK